MGDRSNIEWTEATWNPVTGCTEVSPGCDNCYAKTFAERWRGIPGHHFENGFDITLRPERLEQPLRWRRPRRIFVNSLSDLFHDAVPDEFIARVFAVMARTPQHTYQLLTKRHGRMRSLVKGHDGSGHRLVEATQDEDTARALYDAEWPLPNVWLGVSVENQKWADIRVPALLDTPAAVRWLSCEPLLGGVELRTNWLRPVPGCRFASTEDGLCAHPQAATPECHRFSDCPASPDSYRGVDWVVVGGESGHGARPMHPQWARSLRDQCESVGVPFFFKQHGAWRPGGDAAKPARYVLLDGSIDQTAYGRSRQGAVAMVNVGKGAAGRVLDGRTWDQFPLTADLAHQA